MRAYVRSHAGFTRKLSCHISNNLDGFIHSWVDGPYGGVGRCIENEYDRIIFVAGGTGISSCLPWLQHISQTIKDGTIRTTSIKLLWAMRDAVSLGWISPVLDGISHSAIQGRVVMEFFVTSKDLPKEKLPLRMSKIEAADGDRTLVMTSGEAVQPAA